MARARTLGRHSVEGEREKEEKKRGTISLHKKEREREEGTTESEFHSRNGHKPNTYLTFRGILHLCSLSSAPPFLLLYSSLSFSLSLSSPFSFFFSRSFFPFACLRRLLFAVAFATVRSLSPPLSLSLAAPGNAYSRVFWIIKSTRRVNNVRASLVADFLVFLSCSLLPSNRRRHNATIGKRLRAPNPLFIHKSYGNSAPLSGRREQVRVYHRHLAPRVSVRITIGIQGWLSLSSKGESITAIVLWSTMRV